jgi:hypothetical protein
MAYAKKTRVPVSKTEAEIKRLVMAAGAQSYVVMTSKRLAQVGFEMKGRKILFRLPFPERVSEQEERARWRGLLLCIKAKIDAVARKIESFDEAFMAHVMMPDGQTFAEHVGPRIEAAYKGENVPLLPYEPKAREI